MIKSFIYLDEYKMYSLSSQIFEGITEYTISDKMQKNEGNETQKGPIGSGKTLNDLFTIETKLSEKKYLHDYNYVLFEKNLIESGKVRELNSKNINQIDFSNIDNSFVKVTSTAIFNDINSILSTIENFNELGKALALVTNYHALEETKKQLNKAISDIKDKNQKSNMESKLKSALDIGKMAKEMGLNFDQKYLDSLDFILKYGFKNILEIQLPLGDKLFSTCLIRENLRESEDFLIRKYSRKSEKNFSIFGIMTQYSPKPKKVEIVNSEYSKIENPTMKEALMNLVDHITFIESTFIGRLSNEIIIDPIAVYSEI